MRYSISFPRYREGHSESTEAVADEGVVGDASFSQEGAEITTREEMHVVASSPAFANLGRYPVETGFGEEEMEEGEAGVDLDGEMAIGGGEEASLSHSPHFSDERQLALAITHMFDDSIGVSNIEGVVRKGKMSPIGSASSHLGIVSLESVPIFFETDRGDVLWVGVETFEMIVILGIFLGVDSDIDDGRLGCRLGPFQKLEPFPRAAFP